eukprot:16099193-Heterocapsa_arctica.AAC.1
MTTQLRCYRSSDRQPPDGVHGSWTVELASSWSGRSASPSVSAGTRTQPGQRFYYPRPTGLSTDVTAHLKHYPTGLTLRLEH